MVAFDKMKTAELEVLNQKLMQERTDLRSRHSEVAAALDKNLVRDAATLKLAKMGDAEREAMSQILNSGSISSSEGVGKPG